MNSCCRQKEVITCEQAPKAIGPYSVAISTGCLVFLSGQLGLDPNSGSLVEGGVQAQTRQALTNLKAILESAGTNLESVVKTTVFLQDMSEFGQMNSVYGEFFTQNQPARSAVQVAALPKGGAVEVEAIAMVPRKDHEQNGCCQ
ncbi:MAG: RidA family protein [Anaerolineaceae bacterium]